MNLTLVLSLLGIILLIAIGLVIIFFAHRRFYASQEKPGTPNPPVVEGEPTTPVTLSAADPSVEVVNKAEPKTEVNHSLVEGKAPNVNGAETETPWVAKSDNPPVAPPTILTEPPTILTEPPEHGLQAETPMAAAETETLAGAVDKQTPMEKVNIILTKVNEAKQEAEAAVKIIELETDKATESVENVESKIKTTTVSTKHSLLSIVKYIQIEYNKIKVSAHAQYMTLDVLKSKTKATQAAYEAELYQTTQDQSIIDKLNEVKQTLKSVEATFDRAQESVAIITQKLNKVKLLEEEVINAHPTLISPQSKVKIQLDIINEEANKLSADIKQQEQKIKQEQTKEECDKEQALLDQMEKKLAAVQTARNKIQDLQTKAAEAKKATLKLHIQPRNTDIANTQNCDDKVEQKLINANAEKEKLVKIMGASIKEKQADLKDKQNKLEQQEKDLRDILAKPNMSEIDKKNAQDKFDEAKLAMYLAKGEYEMINAPVEYYTILINDLALQQRKEQEKKKLSDALAQAQKREDQKTNGDDDDWE